MRIGTILKFDGCVAEYLGVLTQPGGRGYVMHKIQFAGKVGSHLIVHVLDSQLAEIVEKHNQQAK